MCENLTMQMTLLGSFSIVCSNGREFSDRSSRSRKMLSLIAYLIAHRGRDIPQSELIEALWTNEEMDDPSNTLKTLLHRARITLGDLGFASGKELILSTRGGYTWNIELPIFIDAEDFDNVCRQAFAAEDDAKLDLLRRAIALYTGDFLPKCADDAWASPLVMYYRSQYLKCVRLAVDRLTGMGEFAEVIEICQKAVTIEPYDESLHLSLLRALIDNGMQQAALQHYNSVTERFQKEFGIDPSPELVALHKEIVKTTKITEMNLHVIREELCESERIEGAFFCEYEFFRDVYRLNARAASRSGQIMHIALISVIEGAGKPLTPRRLNTAMERLRETIGHSLRRGDVYTRYSVSQFLLMLPTANRDNSEKILNRISKAYRKDYSRSNILLHYSILPMEPLLGKGECV